MAQINAFRNILLFFLGRKSHPRYMYIVCITLSVRRAMMINLTKSEVDLLPCWLQARLATEVPVSKNLQDNLWEIATLVCCQTFVDGFSAAKKCTNEGRALMQLDFRQFVLKLEKLSGVKPLPHQQFVSIYIKAYYIPESELGAWVEQHPEYTAVQLRALVASNSSSNNKTKQKLNSLINDLSERIRR